MFGEPALLALALAAEFLALDASWAWSGFYHGFQPATNIVEAVAVVSFAAFLIALVLAKIWSRGEMLLRFALVVLFLYWAATIMASYAFADPVQPYIKVLLALDFVLAGSWCVANVKAERWQRVYKAIVVGALIFAASFPIIGRATAQENHEVFSRLFLKQAPSASANLVIILFDETSPELAGPIIAALEKNGLALQLSTIRAAGKNTINVIPAMLTGDRFDTAIPCGISLLCSDRKALDFAKLSVSPERPVDVIGFFHPYCKIRGLRSCSVIPWGQIERLASSLKQVACDHLLEELDCANRFTPIKQALRRTNALPEMVIPREPVQDEWLEAFRSQLFAAPFWERGGTLYAHIPLPHLPSRITSGNLAEDYRSNVQQAARIVDDITVRLRARFGQDFLIVITSDHPLRLQLACSEADYKGPSCRAGLPENKGMVPFIVASPYAVEPIRVSTNAGLLL